MKFFLLKYISATLLAFCCLGSLQAKTTVISHGYVFPGKDPVNGWMLEMAEAICERNGGGTIRKYDCATGVFRELISHPGDDTLNVLLFDWAIDSNDADKGHSEASGNALFCALIMGADNDEFDLENLHFIGHSRGCVVNSEAAERLLSLGKPVEQMTILDAHDWGLHLTHTDYYVNPLFLNSGIEAWEGVEWADSYWQEAPVGLSGRPVNGTFITKLGVTWHTDVFKWYIETIKNKDSKEGYYYSAIGGGSKDRPEISGQPHPPYFDFLSESIFNGDFRFSPPVSKQTPGWFHHGGSGTGHIENGELELDRGNGAKQHDRFYIPAEAKHLVFEFRTNNADGFKSNGIDHLSVSINDLVMNKFPLQETHETLQEHSIDVKEFREKVVTLTFKIVDERGDKVFINSEVKIDNVRLK